MNSAQKLGDSQFYTFERLFRRSVRCRKEVGTRRQFLEIVVVAQKFVVSPEKPKSLKSGAEILVYEFFVTFFIAFKIDS